MVNGAVIIGRQIGPRMIRPFKFHDFFELEEKCGLALMARYPFEVAYPASLDNPKGGYMEGILVNVFGGDRTSDEFEKYVSERIVDAAKRCEKLWCEAMQHGNRTFFSSDLSYQKIILDNEIKWKPIMQILATYDEDDAPIKYAEIASNLSARTRDARIKRYTEEQGNKYIDDTRRLTEYFRN